MKRGWAIAGVSLGVALGFGMSTSLGAFQSSAKDDAARQPDTEVSAQQTGTTTTDTKFVEINPVRAFDSRVPAYVASGALAPNSSRHIAVKDGHNGVGGVTLADAVPVGATAVSYNLTVAGPTGPNFVSITPGDATGFTTSQVNFNGTTDVANAGIVAIDPNRTVKVWNGNQSGTTHVIIDITGYYVKPIYAQVAANGTLTNGSRAVSVTKLAGTGWYEVKFDRNIRTCVHTATIGADPFDTAGLIDTGGSKLDTIEVFTQNNDGNPPAFEDRAFHLNVIC